ncbi:MAG TPA: class I SAM-dependent methyltransferase [Longimicrobiales bacterium]
MSRFGDDPKKFFDSTYLNAAPWDIGRPQPAMVELLGEFPPESPVLDVGCGSGDLAIHLAQRGLDVVGIDFVAEAIRQAQTKAEALARPRASSIEFRVADAMRPSLLGRRFGAVVDSGFFHVLTPKQCDDYVAELARTLRPGGRYYLHEFAIEFDLPHTPRRITEEELRQRFTRAAGWHILQVRTGEFLSRVAPVPAILACVERLG